MSEWFDSYFGQDYFHIYEGAFSDETTTAEVDGIVSLLNMAPGGRILDLACGHGRHAIPLSKRGFEVTGYDLSEVFLERARHDAMDQGTDVRWIRGDMRELAFDAEFDAVVNMFTAFGYFADDKEDLDVLKRIRSALKPGGRFLLEILHRDALPARFRPSDVTRRSDGTVLLHERTWHLDTDVLDDEVTMIAPDGKRKVYRTSVRMRTLKGYIELLRDAGLEPEAWYGGMEGKPLTLESRRLVIVSQKS